MPEAVGHGDTLWLGMTRGTRLAWIAAPVLAILCSTTSARAQQGQAQERQKTETHGPALSAGIGSQYAGLGIQASYYLQLPGSQLRAAPFVGFGSVIWAFGPQETEEAWLPLGTVAGLSMSWGRKHRLTLDFFYGAVGTTRVSLHGEEPDTSLEWGPGGAAGYEYATVSGFFLRTSLGIQYVVTAPILAPANRIVLAGTFIAVGYKLW
jgi:hypothetical protein